MSGGLDPRVEQDVTPPSGSDLSVLRLLSEQHETKVAVGVVSRQVTEESEKRAAEHQALADSLDEMAKGLEGLKEQGARILDSMSKQNKTIETLDKRVSDIALRLGAVEQKPGGTSGIIRAYNDRASLSEESLKEANEALRAEREARITEDRERLLAEIENSRALRESEIKARRARELWVTRAVVFLCGAGGLALIGAFAKACGG